MLRTLTRDMSTREIVFPRNLYNILNLHFVTASGSHAYKIVRYTVLTALRTSQQFLTGN